MGLRIIKYLKGFIYPNVSSYPDHLRCFLLLREMNILLKGNWGFLFSMTVCKKFEEFLTRKYNRYIHENWFKKKNKNVCEFSGRLE